jgi:hypothetical protein
MLEVSLELASLGFGVSLEIGHLSLGIWQGVSLALACPP